MAHRKAAEPSQVKAGGQAALHCSPRRGVFVTHHPGQPVGGDMGIDLRRRDVGVAQQGLDHPQVSAAFQQVGGEGVAQDVGADPGGVDAGVDGGLVQQLGEPSRG